MIFTERTIKIANDVCKIDNPIVLYRGDYNVEIRFTIIECPYKYSTKNSTNIIETVDASYGQLVIKVPNDGFPIFSDVVETKGGSVVFTLSGEMIDESIEVGDYTFQIRLFDANKESRATIPPIENGISIREPIAFEDVTTTNEVGEATVGYALTTAATPEDAFDSQGNYNKTTWGTGDRITAAKLNKIEAGIDGVNKKVASGGTGSGGVADSVDWSNVQNKPTIPTKTSQLTNDSGYITSIPDEYITETELNAKGYATTSQIPTVPTNVSDFTNDANYASETYVTNKIAEAQLGGGGGVDLSGYVTKEVGNANQITFADGQTFQAKLDAGTLKGDKGDTGAQGPQGDKGADGLTTSISVNGTTYTQVDGLITLPNYSTGTGSNNASDITITDTGNYFTNSDVEGALQEVGSQIKEIANSGNISSIEPAANDMPKVFFYGNALPTTKDNVNLTMDYVSNTTKFSSFVKLKCQGTSSMSYAKKNFTVAMYSDEARGTALKKDFKGWGAQSKFCLKANYVDTTHTRNISGARIAYDMVLSRPDSLFKRQLSQCPRNGAVDGFPIKLYFDGEFYGIYTWNIPKDGWMFNMDESNPNHVVLCAEKNTDGNASAINSCQFRKLWDGGGDWSYEFGTPSDTVKNSFNRCINFVMTATDQEFYDNISDYFDLYSLLDYYCFSYFCCHLDGLAKNMLMATYDGVIWGASLYDMDSIYGVHYNGNSYVATNYQCPEQYQEQFSLLWKRIEQCFGAELYARYLELRQGALSLSNIIKHVEEIYDVIPDRVFADEKAKWTSLPQVNTNTMTRFRNYMRDRAVYVDAQMLEIGTKIDCTGITLNQTSVELTADNTTVTLVATVEPSNTTNTITWSSNATNIATVDNGLVTAKANGSAVITATCGTQSATCNVTVSGISESGGNTPAENILQTIEKRDGYYNDSGVFTQWGALKTTDYIDMPTVSGRVKHTDGTAQLGVTRVSYFDENKTYLGYNRGSGFGVASEGTGSIELDMNKGAKYFVVSSEDFSVLTYEYEGDGISGGDTPSGGAPANLVFRVDSTSMNTTDNTLTDNMAGISATLTGNPTVSGNQIVFTASDTFSFNISSLNLTSSNRTVRVKFTPTTLDNNNRNITGLGSSTDNWNSMTSSYISSQKLILQYGNNGFSNNTVGGTSGGYNNNRLLTTPVTGQEYELVISENIDGNVRWYVDGILVQNGRTTLHNPLYLSNVEGNVRFIGSYSLIEIYNEYCETYEVFTSMVNA